VTGSNIDSMHLLDSLLLDVERGRANWSRRRGTKGGGGGDMVSVVVASNPFGLRARR